MTFDPILQICQIWSQNWNMLRFLWNLALEQTEHANYEYCAWNWGSWLKVIDLGKSGLNTEIYSSFHEMWHSGHIWYANYQYSTLNGWTRPKERNFGKFCPKLEMCAILMNFDTQN